MFKLKTCCFIAFVLMLSPLTWGQENFPSKGTSNYLGLEVNKAMFHVTDNVSLSPLSMNYFFYGRMGGSDKLKISFDIPVTHYRLDVENTDSASSSTSSQTAMGNPLIEATVSGPTSHWKAALGLRLPLSNDKNSALILGSLSSLNKIEAFIPNNIPLILDISYQPNQGLLAPDISIAPRLWVPSRSNGSLEYFLNYKIGANVHFNPYIISIGWIGYGDLSAISDYSHNFIDHLYLNAFFELRGIGMGSFLKLPFDEGIRKVYNFTMGFYIQQAFGL